MCVVGVAVSQVGQHPQEAGCWCGFQAVHASIGEDAEVVAGRWKCGEQLADMASVLSMMGLGVRA